MESNRTLYPGSQPGITQNTPLVLSSSGSTSFIASLTKSVTNSRRNFLALRLSLFWHEEQSCSVILIVSKPFGRLIMFLHSGKPVHAMKREPYFEVLTFIMCFRH